jgi:hypothetical protein
VTGLGGLSTRGIGLTSGLTTTRAQPSQPSNPAAAVTPGDPAKITFNVLNSSTRTISVLADLNTGRPTLTGGGAKWNTIERPQRASLTVFAGYDPLQISIPVLFDNFIAGDTIQDDVDMLWLMWGRGPGAANASKHKAAPVLGVTGDLMPPITQASSTNPGPPNWVITQIDEDGASAVLNKAQHLVRLAVVVSLQEYVSSSALDSLAGTKKPSGTKTNVYPKGSTMRKVATLQQTTVKILRDLNNYGHNHALDKYLRDPSKKFAKHVSVKVPRVEP